MPRTPITIPAIEVKEIVCPSCAAVARYHVIKQQWPHLYCTYCHNAYVELGNHPRLKGISTNFFAKKAMQLIEGEAQLCRCGGMFLFRTRVHCVHCGEPLPFAMPNGGRARMRYSDLIVFDGSEVRFDDGQSNLYHLDT